MGVRRQEEGLVRIGTLARRTGVSPELLRAWERRYGLLRPARSEGGYRLYDAADEEVIRRMRLHLAGGLSAREAARLARGSDASGGLASPPGPERVPAGSAVERLARDLRSALDRFDERAAQEAVDRLLAVLRPVSVVTEVFFPLLRDLGRRWAAGTATVADEHFASAVVRARILGLARAWGSAHGPTAVLSCPPGEHHDIGLAAFGLALRAHGWRIAFTGANTPLDAVEAAAARTGAALAVLSTTDPRVLHESLPSIRRLARRLPVAVGGPGAVALPLEDGGPHPLVDDVPGAAEAVAAGALAGPPGPG